MIDQVEMMRVVQSIRGDAVVIPSMRAVIGWERAVGDMNRVIPLDSAYIPSGMGKASSFALGLCLARPDTKVIVFDGDGSLLMNLGTLVTISNVAPPNLYHFVMDNGVYATTGGQEVPGEVSYAEMAREAGYAHTYQFDDLEDFATQARQILDEPGPTMICLKTVPDVRLPQERAARQGPRPVHVPSKVIREAQRQLGSAG